MSTVEIKIGLSISLSGKFRLQGEQALRGLQLWHSYINAQGGLPLQNQGNRVVRLIWYDDHSEIGVVQRNLFRLLRED